MKALFFILCFASVMSFGQVLGPLANDHRKIVTDVVYDIEMDTTGVVIFDIAVNMDGKVTSCHVNKAETTIHSTPLMITCKNRILAGLSFEKGYAFPEFHQGKVQFNVVRPVAEKKR